MFGKALDEVAARGDLQMHESADQRKRRREREIVQKSETK